MPVKTEAFKAALKRGDLGRAVGTCPGLPCARHTIVGLCVSNSRMFEAIAGL